MVRGAGLGDGEDDLGDEEEEELMVDIHDVSDLSADDDDEESVAA